MPTAAAHHAKILIIDDDIFNRDGLRLYLKHQGFEILEAGDAATAYQVATAQQPDVAIIDIVIPTAPRASLQMSRSTGIRLARQLKKAIPSLGIVFFSAHEDRGSEVWEMVQEGTRGLVYKLKGCRPGALLQAIHEAMAGHVLIDSEVLTNPRSLVDELLERLTADERPWVESAVACLDRLTPREQDIAHRLAASHTTQGIARSLGIAPKTVENHIGHIYSKLELSNLTGKDTSLRKVMILAKACMVNDLLRS